MNDNDFKLTLIKALKNRMSIDNTFATDEMNTIIMTLPRCNVYIEETDLFTYREWDTYCSILHIQAPVDKQNVFVKEHGKILDIAESIYGRQGDNYLTNLDIGILVEHYEVIDFSSISITDVVKRAISDADGARGQV